MGNTPNHNYNTPSEGTSDWHIPLNQNFEQLDIDVEIRGPEAEKGNHDPKVGAKYEATDSGAVYYGDGNSWILANRTVNELRSENISTTQFQEKGPIVVSPSASKGYDSLQVALDDAANGVTNEIWITENIQENVLIPNSKTGDNWDRRDGLAIRGMSGSHTMIKDDLADGTPIMKVESANISKLTLEGLEVEPSGVPTRAFSQARYEEDTNGSMPLAHFAHCRFHAPVIVSKVYHSYFEDCIFRPYVGTKRFGEKIYPGFMLNAGNQYMFDRCHFVDRTGKVKYGTCWMSGANSGLFNSCFFSVTGKGYNEGSDRPTAPLLIDTGGDMIFNLPYCEVEADYAMVTDAIEGGGNAIDNLRINGSRLGGIKLNNRVKNFVIDGSYQGHKIDLTSGVASEGSWVRTNNPNPPDEAGLEVVGGNKKYLRVVRGRGKGWEVPTPPLPVDGDAGRRNDYSVPVTIYQSGGGEARITDYHGNKRFIPAGSSPIMLGLNEQIYYNNTYPDRWEWYGME
jgi:hypothetical protein